MQAIFSVTANFEPKAQICKWKNSSGIFSFCACQIQNNMLQFRKSKEEKSRLLDMSQRACVGASRYRRNSWTWSRSCVPKRYRLGYDGFTRYRDRLSMNHFSSVVDKAYVVRHKWIWGGNTKHMLSSLKYFREEGFFVFIQSHANLQIQAVQACL